MALLCSSLAMLLHSKETNLSLIPNFLIQIDLNLVFLSCSLPRDILLGASFKSFDFFMFWSFIFYCLYSLLFFEEYFYRLLYSDFFFSPFYRCHFFVFCFVLFTAPPSIWNPTKEWTHNPCIGSAVLTTGLPGLLISKSFNHCLFLCSASGHFPHSLLKIRDTYIGKVLTCQNCSLTF